MDAKRPYALILTWSLAVRPASHAAQDEQGNCATYNRAEDAANGKFSQRSAQFKGLEFVCQSGSYDQTNRKSHGNSYDKDNYSGGYFADGLH
ncbi:hypothetical protein [Mesorhizobium sp. ES1-4]|uniref:hypothetical protein n=1 Tax=Mesorhizobium sp. ES1-4 TaxID=2876627 RepID=UPI001CCC53C5|nr:hypothetical protein [Mesorhizobium sp. ES1-4]MBZ9795070.1 hypothetical protein [Mesorhizobium sp. ES1-4]